MGGQGNGNRDREDDLTEMGGEEEKRQNRRGCTCSQNEAVRDVDGDWSYGCESPVYGASNALSHTGGLSLLR